VKVLWLAWKDKNHPGAGGAEVVLHELSEELIAHGHEVTILTARYGDAPAHEVVDGITIIRVGTSRYLHPFIALAYYVRHLRNTFDIVIETVNTAPYFATFLKNKGKRPLLFYHQLARKIWYHEAPPGVNHLGYFFIEPLSTFLLGRTRARTITVSNSTKQDLQRFGFRAKDIAIISQVNHLPPAATLEGISKYDQPTVLSLGAARGMKQTIDQIKAFEIAKKTIPNLQLLMAGDTSTPYGQRVLEYIAHSPYKNDIQHLGRVPHDKKIELMQRAHIITVSSVKEGWGLIVTEAAGQGTPAVVYDIDGLRDSVRHLETGIITAASPSALADGVCVALSENELYNSMRQKGWDWSKQFTLSRSYNDFINILEQS
jgi:glycosyltransferase involved in cell wall biosynthesis